MAKRRRMGHRELQHWYGVRMSAMLRDDWSCVVCSRRGWQEVNSGAINPNAPEWKGRTAELDARPELDVHHLTYERYGCEVLDDVVTLCQSCHVKEHWRIRKGEPTLLGAV